MKDKHKNNCFRVINISKNRKKHRGFTLFLIIFALFFVYIKFLATPMFLNNTKTQIDSYMTKSINFAIADAMKQNLTYDELINIIKDENNNISLIEANAVKINSLSRNINKFVIDYFYDLMKNPLKIPLGSFSGISIFSGLGPEISYEVNNYSEVFCNFVSNFESAGINQTYHKIYLNITLKNSIIMPFKKIETSSSSKLLVCETLIVGKIPEVYLNTNTLTKMLNLVP